MSIEIKLLHHTPFRARYFCDFLKEDINIEQLEFDLLKTRSVTKVRINKKVNSIVFECFS